MSDLHLRCSQTNNKLKIIVLKKVKIYVIVMTKLTACFESTGTKLKGSE